MVIVFDLDDTLYDDRSFVLSGFHAVARYLAPLLNKDEAWIRGQLEGELQQDRNHVFNRFLQALGISDKKLIRKCVSVYRGHDPVINLYPDAQACLSRLSRFPLYVVTDGNKQVQKRKFLALGLSGVIKKCLCTHVYGIKHSKPSPYCFQVICSLEKVVPSQVVYIADNPYKDFIGIKPLGFHTIRVLTGHYGNSIVSPEYDAELTVKNLNEVTAKLMHDWGQKKI